MSEVVAIAGQAYMRQLQAHPLRTKAITSGFLAGCSDAVAQKISGVSKLQLRRLLLIACDEQDHQEVVLMSEPAHAWDPQC